MEFRRRSSLGSSDSAATGAVTGTEPIVAGRPGYGVLLHGYRLTAFMDSISLVDGETWELGMGLFAENHDPGRIVSSLLSHPGATRRVQSMTIDLFAGRWRRDVEGGSGGHVLPGMVDSGWVQTELMVPALFVYRATSTSSTSSQRFTHAIVEYTWKKLAAADESSLRSLWGQSTRPSA